MAVVRDETYTYDAVGNRIDLGAVVEAGNRLTSFNGYTMTYDPDGNLRTKTGHGVSQSFGWNGFGQLESVTTNGVLTTFGYDGLGRRVRKTTSGVTTRFLYDGDNLVMQLDGAGQPQLEFSYYPGVDHPHAVRVGTGAVYYYATDGRAGHVTALVDQRGAVVNQYEYTPFGERVTAVEQVMQPFRFTGRELDRETGLYYYRARYYDPTLARFISEDPIGLAGGVNQYAYVGSDPVNRIDPSGLCDGPTKAQFIHQDNGAPAWVADNCKGYGSRVENRLSCWSSGNKQSCTYTVLPMG
jgi:RHS repeat-associated protein